MMGRRQPQLRMPLQDLFGGSGQQLYQKMSPLQRARSDDSGLQLRQTMKNHRHSPRSAASGPQLRQSLAGPHSHPSVGSGPMTRPVEVLPALRAQMITTRAGVVTDVQVGKIAQDCRAMHLAEGESMEC